jgi:hypothetical protein
MSADTVGLCCRVAVLPLISPQVLPAHDRRAQRLSPRTSSLYNVKEQP